MMPNAMLVVATGVEVVTTISLQALANYIAGMAEIHIES